jgi:hypothetical protein
MCQIIRTDAGGCQELIGFVTRRPRSGPSPDAEPSPTHGPSPATPDVAWRTSASYGNDYQLFYLALELALCFWREPVVGYEDVHI